MDRHRHLLTVIHAAERTGPPLLALRFLTWLRDERPGWRLTTVCLDAGGELVEDFERLGEVVHVAATGGSASARRRRDLELGRRLREIPPVDVAHVHCAGSMRVVPMLPPASILCHVHELSVGLDFHLDPAARRHLDEADAYIAVSDCVRAELLSRFSISPDAVERQWGFFDPRTPDALPDRGSVRDDDVLVVASGVRHWRKAPMLFVRLAQRARQLHPEIPWRFVWVGGSGGPRYDEVVIGGGLDGIVEFIDHVADPLPVIAAADIFVLTAREDAFPLVCVEAAARGRPLVTFDNGGSPELIEAAGCGRVVPFPDVDEMARTVANLAHSPTTRRDLGRAGAVFAERELSLTSAGPRLVRSIERLMAAR